MPGIFGVVDFANMMTYDIHGVWEAQTNHHTALYTNPKANDPDNGIWAWSTDDTVNYLLKNGATADKISIGAAFYARGWGNVEAGTDPALPGLFQKADFASVDADGGKSRGAANEKPLVNGDGGRNGGIWAFRSLDKLKSSVPDLTEYWDDVAKAPYLYSQAKKQFYTFENERSIAAKTAYIKEKQLGGMIVWMQSQDKATVEGSQRRDQLTTAMKQGLFGEKALTQQVIRYPSQQLKAELSATTVNQKEMYQLLITNQEVLKETDPVLKQIEMSAKTTKLPVLTVTTAQGEVVSSPTLKEARATGTQEANQIDLLPTGIETIAPGETVTIQLSTSAPVADLNNILDIQISQRMATTGALLGTQAIYTKASDVETLGTVRVHHQDAQGKELAESSTMTGQIGTAFEAAPVTVSGYQLSQTPTNSKGIFKRDEQSVIFVYAAETVESSITSEAPKEKETMKEKVIPKKKENLPKTGTRKNHLVSSGLLMIGTTLLWFRRKVS